jgi:sugar transferase EpsL
MYLKLYGPHLHESAKHAMSYPGKRVLDLAVVVVASPLWVPLTVAVALIVRSRLGAPVLFRQQRAGMHGRTFELLKFRTMTDTRDSDGRLHPDAVRLTTLGRTLRALSLDEFPQFLNILHGDMSLVGPRPLLPHYLARYSAWHARRHDVRPGLTGLAQVSGRNLLSWDERLDLDVKYVERSSLCLDLIILLRTVIAVLRREGVNTIGNESMPEFLGTERTQYETHAD